MSKTDCDIIKDLLPLYEDNICSEKSKDLIEEHLIECEDCREYLESLHGELPPMEPSSEDTAIDETRLSSGSSARSPARNCWPAEFFCWQFWHSARSGITLQSAKASKNCLYLTSVLLPIILSQPSYTG